MSTVSFMESNNTSAVEWTTAINFHLRDLRTFISQIWSFNVIREKGHLFILDLILMNDQVQTREAFHKNGCKGTLNVIEDEILLARFCIWHLTHLSVVINGRNFHKVTDYLKTNACFDWLSGVLFKKNRIIWLEYGWFLIEITLIWGCEWWS